MRINIRLGKNTVIHNSVELCTPENWRRLSFAFFAKYLPLGVTQGKSATQGKGVTQGKGLTQGNGVTQGKG